MATRLLLVMAGGAIGSAARYWLSGFVQQRAGAAFPYGTLAVNVAGCLVFGFVIGLETTRAGALGASTRLFILMGLCGGFTTFSAFGYETLELLRAGQSFAAAANVALQVVIGLAALWAGAALARAAA
jgi:CrcB protein